MYSGGRKEWKLIMAEESTKENYFANYYTNEYSKCRATTTKLFNEH